MRKKKRIFIVAGIVVTLVVAILMYEKVALFPHQWQAQLRFMIKEDQLNELIDEIEKHEKLKRISLIGDTIWVRTYEGENKKQELKGMDAEKFEELIKKAGLPIAWKIDGGVLVYLWSEEKLGKRFDFAFMCIMCYTT